MDPRKDTEGRNKGMDAFVCNVMLLVLGGCFLKSMKVPTQGIVLWPRSPAALSGPLVHGIIVLAFQETILVRKRLGLVHFFFFSKAARKSSAWPDLFTHLPNQAKLGTKRWKWKLIRDSPGSHTWQFWVFFFFFFLFYFLTITIIFLIHFLWLNRRL